MGCSPSKGNNFGTQGPFKRGTTLLPVHQEIPGESQSDDGSCGGSSTTGDTDGEPLERSSGEWKLVGQTDSTQKEATSTLQKKKASLSEVVPVCVLLDKVGAQEIDTNKLLQEKAKHGDKQDMADKKSGRKPKKNNKAVKLIKKKEKEQKASIVDQKVDFPEPLVKAHQAAYGFLNPSISKYEILLNLLDQATQTQVSVQPMVAFMAMRYDEINQGLREMAEEGEKLLKENGEHLAWPSLMKNLSSNLSKTGSTNTEPPPDLLQQLLQYTTQRMQSVSQSVGGIGDSALEEAADYFASVSVLLEEKLKAKQAIEARLMQLLTRIEAASIRKPGPDDSALFSEDSGIGAESESLTGSERRLRRESCESTGTIRTCPCSPTVVNRNLTRGQAASWRTCNNQSPRVFRGGIDSGCSVKEKCQKDTESLLASASLDDGEDDEDARGEEDADDVEEGSRKRSNSSPPDPEHVPRRLPSKRIENPQNVEMTLKMKDALSGRIRFASSQHAKTKTMPIESPKTSRRQWVEDEGKSPKRPQTAAPVRKALKKAPVGKEHRSQSEESLRNKAEDPTLLELERTQRDLNQRLAKMSKGKTTGNKTNPTKQNQGNTPQSSISNRLHPSMEKNSNTLPKQNKSGLMKCNTGEQESSKDTENKTKNKKTKAPLKATPPPSPPPSRPPSGLYRGRNSVKKLIDTFSQGMEEPKPESSKVLGPLKGVRKCGVPILPGLGNVEAALSAGLTSCRVDGLDKNEDLDLDNLPPPPLEVLMDNSFEGAQSLSVSDLDDGVLSRGRSLVAKRATVSQRLRASMQSATVLPSKGNMPRGSRSMSPARTIRKPHISTNISQREGIQTGEDLETEEAASLYKQARKVIHLRHSFDSAEKKALPFSLPVKPSLSQSELGDKQDESRPDGSSQSEVVPTFKVINSRPHETSPVLRARVLPTTPSVAGSLHRRLPSPSVFKRQPTPPSSASSPVVRDLPTPPPVQRRLPSPPAVRREMTPNTHSVSASPFKAPSPPASPRFHRFSRGNSNEDPGAISSPRLISNARSVFCPASPSLFEAHSCPVPQPPQAWTATGVSFVTRAWGDRGRFPMSARGPKPFVKRSHSDRRPSLSMPPRAPTISVAQTCGSEPALSLQGLYDEPTRDPELWHSQSDLRGSTRSASHPDLCIVGQALHRE